MKNDERCCGSGTCIIDARGCCWCGQQWDGEKMVHKPLAKLLEPDIEPEVRPSPAEPAVPRD